MARRSDHSRDEIRQMALDAAEKIIIQHGYKGLSARKIATDMGYTVGTLYLIFKNLDELILHLNMHTLDALYEQMGITVERNPAPEKCVQALCRAYYDFACSNTHRWSLMFEHNLSEDMGIPEWFSAKVAYGFTLLERVLQPLVKEKKPAEVCIAARALWGGVHGITMLAVTDKLDVSGVNSVTEILDSLVENYMQGFVSGAG